MQFCQRLGYQCISGLKPQIVCEDYSTFTAQRKQMRAVGEIITYDVGTRHSKLP